MYEIKEEKELIKMHLNLISWNSLIPFIFGWIANELIKPLIFKFGCTKLELNKEILLINKKDERDALKNIYSVITEFDDLFSRLNSSYIEIPKLLKKLEELNLFIKSNTDFHKKLNDFYYTYLNIHYFLNVLTKNKHEADNSIGMEKELEKIHEIWQHYIFKAPQQSVSLKKIIKKKIIL